MAYLQLECHGSVAPLMKGRTGRLLGFSLGTAYFKNMQTSSSGVGMVCVCVVWKFSALRCWKYNIGGPISCWLIEHQRPS